MYGIDYINHSSYYALAALFALVVMITGSVTDLKKREVADMVNYGLFFGAIALRLIYAAIELDPHIILEGFLGFIVFTSLGLAMFYSGQWGGGDSKMIIGLGVLFGLPATIDLYALGNSMLISFIINSFIVGALYGLVWCLIIALKDTKKFKKTWSKIRKDVKAYELVCIVSGLIVIGAGYIIPYLKALLIPIGIILAIMIYAYIFTKTVEKGHMTQMMATKDVTEGEWIDKPVYHKGKYVCGPKDLGISKKQIALLKKYKIKKVPVKIGVPFVPSFLLGFIVTLIFGNIITAFIGMI